MHQDAEARTQFLRVVALTHGENATTKRARHYALNPKLAAEPMAPIFAVKTLDGQDITLDDLTGKVVLIDFWATWCEPCREALPHIQKLASEFSDEPFVVLSVSLDSDEEKWKTFVEHHNMTWLQYRDGGFQGPIARKFGITEIPSTFTIDADGVLADQRPGDVEIESNLKILFAEARKEAESPKPGQ